MECACLISEDPHGGPLRTFPRIPLVFHAARYGLTPVAVPLHVVAGAAAVPTPGCTLPGSEWVPAVTNWGVNGGK